jgi:hypothetical protein
MGNVDNSLYDSDFYLWTQQAAERLRAGNLSADDVARAAEEIADMGKRDRRELQSRMIVLVMHLMKWSVQPHLRNNSTWLDTISEQRIQIDGVLEQSPSLRPFLLAELPTIFAKAALHAAVETKLPIESFRTQEPDLARLLSPAHLPDDISCL